MIMDFKDKIINFIIKNKIIKETMNMVKKDKKKSPKRHGLKRKKILEKEECLLILYHL